MMVPDSNNTRVVVLDKTFFSPQFRGVNHVQLDELWLKVDGGGQKSGGGDQGRGKLSPSLNNYPRPHRTCQ